MATGKKNKDLIIEIKLHEKVNAQLDGTSLTLKGPTGEIKREFKDKTIKFEHKDGSI